MRKKVKNFGKDKMVKMASFIGEKGRLEEWENHHWKTKV